MRGARLDLARGESRVRGRVGWGEGRKFNLPVGVVRKCPLRKSAKAPRSRRGEFFAMKAAVDLPTSPSLRSALLA